jgi:FAD/FMN-containing dehydrogenase
MTSFHQKRVAGWSNVLPTTTSLAEGPEDWDRIAALPGTALIARGSGCSFGDASYLGGGFTYSTLIHRTISPFDTAHGTIEVGAGVTMGSLHRYLDSTPYEFAIFGGTERATVGGAVAGDIHGKNHSVAGSFGHHVVALRLATVDTRRINCSATVESELFRATIGGMGLTGFIESVTLALQPRQESAVCQHRRIVCGLTEMEALFASTDAEFNYCTWFDLARNGARGLFCQAERVEEPLAAARRVIMLPLPRVALLQPWTIGLAGKAILGLARRKQAIVHIRDFNYSGLHEVFPNWNKLYSRKGMIEYQFVLPDADFTAVLQELVSMARHHSLGLLAAVVKKFGAHRSVGLLSFPLPGYTINFQMPNTAEAVGFLQDFTDLLLNCGGKVNLTKDSCITANQFSRMFDNLSEWRQIVRGIDPDHRIRSGLSNRLGMKPW